MKSDSVGLTLEYYCFLATNNRRFLIDSLMQFRSPPWLGLDAATVVDSYTQIKCALAPEPVADDLFERHLLAHRLVAGEDIPEALRAFLDARIQPQNHFDGIDPRAIRDGRWTAVAVPVVASGGKGRIRWFAVGRIDGPPIPTAWPWWVAPLLSTDSQKAINDALLATRNHQKDDAKSTFHLFPLVPANGQCQFHGTSLGLPLALGFLELLTGKPLARGVLATGGITPAGQVQKVSGITEKCADESTMDRFSLMLYPSANAPLGKMDGWESIQVADLEQAFMFAHWYQPGNGNRLSTLSLMLADANAFVNNMADVPCPWIAHFAAKGSLAPLITRITASPALFSRYVRTLEYLLDAWQLEQVSRLSDLVADRLSDALPLAAFRFQTVRLTLANHQGDVAAAERAIGHADRLVDVAMQGDMNRCADYLNNRLVDRHNRFRFDANLGNATHRMVQALEARHEAQCRFGCPTDPVLARLYGTIAQNSAFCGPSRLDDTLNYAELSIQAFGGGQIPEYRQDVRRQHAYLTYANLDAGMREAAREHLFLHLETDEWEHVQRQWEAGNLGQWSHALVARFLAEDDTSGIAAQYLEWCTLNRRAIREDEHPRQLWSLNLGRMALALERLDEAQGWFTESLAICAGKTGKPTIFTMALLPMAELMKTGRLAEVCRQGLIETVADTAHRLNPHHFSPPGGMRRAQALVEAVAENPARYFPFSYR